MLGGSYDPGASGYVLAIDEGEGRMLVMGANARVQFRPACLPDCTANLCKVIEGYFEDGQWRPLRYLDGDEIQLRYDVLGCVEDGVSGQGLNFQSSTPQILDIELYTY